MTSLEPPVISISNLHAYYSECHILQGVNLTIRRGELVTLLGRNGAGRTTTLRAIMGMVGHRTGSIVVNARETIAMRTYKIARLGLGYCPEDRGIFSSLSASENLTLPPIIGRNGMSIEEIFKMFPNLRERQVKSGTQLSGGEQQMLALARILHTGADILLLDEITEGLAPVIVHALSDAIRELKKRGYTIVLVEQNFKFAQQIADRHYVIEHGRVVHTVERGDLESEMPTLQRLLGI